MRECPTPNMAAQQYAYCTDIIIQNNNVTKMQYCTNISQMYSVTMKTE